MSSASSSKHATPDLLGSPPSGLLSQLASHTGHTSAGEASDQDFARALDGLGLDGLALDGLALDGLALDGLALDGLARAIETDARRDPRGYLQRTNTHQHGE